MKRYKLLKDLPYAKAGAIFIVEAGIRKVIAVKIKGGYVIYEE